MPVDVEQLAADADKLMAAARVAGPSGQVPGCPGWSVQELLRHVGAVHRRFGLVIAERRSERPRREESTPPPTDPYDWFDEARGQLLTALANGDDTFAYYSFRGPRPLSWWVRRLVHETSIHRVDAEQAAGRTAIIEPALAADGVAENLATYLPILIGAQPLDRRLAVELVATDVDARWTVICEGKDLLVTTDPAPVQATVRGQAEHLYLWLWGRGLDDRPELTGDRAAAESFRAAARV
jgi:uncharacterized protein (TIGR03083 family)